MSKYTDLADAGELSKEAGDAARLAFWRYSDDMQRLWYATNQLNDFAGCRYYCPACNGSNGNHADDCPHEALRPLFGEGADHE